MANIEKRKNNDGAFSYRVKVRLKGFPTQTASFARLTDAKKWEQATEAAIREGRHFKTSAAKKRTLTQLIERYQKEVIPTRFPDIGDRQIRTSQLNWWKGELGSYCLADVTPSILAEKRDTLLNTKLKSGKNRSPSTVVRYMAALSHAFTIAVKEWGWIEDSPMRKVTKPKEPRGRVRFLSDSERKTLLTTCEDSKSPFLYPVVVLALATGMRQGEILNLTWGDVNLDKQYIILHETKNGERRRIPLVGHAQKEIQKLGKIRRIDTDLLFPHPRQNNKPFNLRAAWDAAILVAKLKDFKFHDLRHSAASYLAMNGASLAEIAEVLGHKTLQMVKRYAHLSEAHTSKVVASMNERIFG